MQDDRLRQRLWIAVRLRLAIASADHQRPEEPHVETSKLLEVFCSTNGAAQLIHVLHPFDTVDDVLCDTSTPGRPVVPEV